MKTNVFETIYSRLLDLRKAYETAANEGDRISVQNAICALLDEIDETEETFSRICALYVRSRDDGNEYLDINGVIRDKDVDSLVSCMRENGIDKFTFSSGWTSAVDTAWLLQQAGCRLEGLVEINSQYRAPKTGEHEKAHGYLFSVG